MTGSCLCCPCSHSTVLCTKCSAHFASLSCLLITYKTAQHSPVHLCLQVVHCLALAADMSGDSAAAIRWLEVLTSLVPHDPGVLCKLGAIYHR